MSRIDRLKTALSNTENKLRSDIEGSHKAGKIPADYSLGFANAVIFFNHHLNMKPDEPKFYDRTTSIGALPKPVALVPKFEGVQGADQVYESLRDAIILAARNVCMAPSEQNADKVHEAIINLDDFVSQMEESKEAGNGEIAASPDEGCSGQEGSIPSPASISGN